MVRLGMVSPLAIPPFSLSAIEQLRMKTRITQAKVLKVIPLVLRKCKSSKNTLWGMEAVPGGETAKPSGSPVKVSRIALDSCAKLIEP